MKQTVRRSARWTSLLVAMLAACGGGGTMGAATTPGSAATPPAAQSVTVAVAPDSATVGVGGTRSFDAVVTGTSVTQVTWTVVEGPTGGTVDGAGLYTAPGSAGTYHVVATSVVDPTKSGSATVSVTARPPTIAVSLSPANATVVAGAPQTFTATVTGTTNSAVTWSVTEGTAGGTITSGGVYTAPAAAGTYHVMARSQADGTATAVATVTVTAAPVTIAISPTTGNVDACTTLPLTATVSGSTNRNVTWTVQEGAAGGTVSSSGVYTAPSTDGTYHVVATSQADTTKTAVATLTVANRVVSVAVSPGSATLTAGSTQQFTATITTTCGQFTATQVVSAPLAAN